MASTFTTPAPLSSFFPFLGEGDVGLSCTSCLTLDLLLPVALVEFRLKLYLFCNLANLSLTLGISELP